MKKTYFNFQHDYYKLKEDEFTTIRGKTAAKQYEIYQVVDITKDREFFCNAIILGMITARISDFTLETLQKDAEYPGFKIESYQDFVDLINSFNPSYYRKATTDSEKTLFRLKKYTIGSDLFIEGRKIPAELIIMTEDQYEFNILRLLVKIHQNEV